VSELYWVPWFHLKIPSFLHHSISSQDVKLARAWRSLKLRLPSRKAYHHGHPIRWTKTPDLKKYPEVPPPPQTGQVTPRRLLRFWPHMFLVFTDGINKACCWSVGQMLKSSDAFVSPVLLKTQTAHRSRSPLINYDKTWKLSNPSNQGSPTTDANSPV